MKRHKYHAKATVCSKGHEHPSKREAKRCEELHLLLRAGEIDALVYEPTYHFPVNGALLVMSNGSKARYRPDFAYRERDGTLVVEDVKGVAVRDFPLRAALFRHCYPHIELRIVK